MKTRYLAPLLLLTQLISGLPAEDSTPKIFPFEPAELLTTLPAAPEEWTLVRSEADTSLREWLAAKATRVFQAPVLPAAGADPASQAPPGEVEVTVVDTAGLGSSLADFADFTPGKNAGFEKKLIGTLPAIIIPGESRRQITQVLVSSRYIVEITLTNLPRQHAEDWLRKMHFDALPPKSTTPTTRPHEFRLSHLDELHPENNRSYLVSTTDSKRLDSFLKSLPAEQSER